METPPKKPTKKRLEERAELLAKAKAAGQDERRLKKAVEAIDAELEQFVRHAEPRKKRVSLHGWLLQVAKVKKRPSWKAELLKAVGVVAVKRLEQEAEEVEKFSVEKAVA